MRNTIRGAASAAVLVFLFAAGSRAASAIPEPGPSRPSVHPQENCPLERIGSQLVRCDNLTGAGAHAPWNVPVQGSR